MRLFAAIFPPHEVLDHLDLAIHSVSRMGASPRWTPRENQHITVAFYADVPEGAVDELVASLAAVAGKHAPLDLRLRGAGSFGSRVLWVGVDGKLTELRRLAADCLDASPREVPDDVKPHRPHLTIARARAGQVRPPRGRDRWTKRAKWSDSVRGGASSSGSLSQVATARGSSRDPFADSRSVLEPAAHALSVYAGPGWTADSFVLMQSHPGQGAQGGPRYTMMETFDLHGGGLRGTDSPL